jgi:hypothetical protein
VGPAKSCIELGQARRLLRGSATVFGDPLGRIRSDPRHSSGKNVSYCSAFREIGVCLRSCTLTMAWRFGSSVRGEPHEWSAGAMRQATSRRKAAAQTDPEEILPEYDFSRSLPNKYASRYAAGSTVVVLDPDVAAACPTSGEANEALRALAGIIQKRASAGEHPGVIRKPASRFTARQASPPAARRRCSQSSAWPTVKPALFKAAMARSRCLSAMRM